MEFSPKRMDYLRSNAGTKDKGNGGQGMRD